VKGARTIIEPFSFPYVVHCYILLLLITASSPLVMPHIQNTPESLLPRSDSKNPATTCKGITSNGRPCRRALASTPHSSRTSSPGRGQGVLAVLHNHNGDLNSVAAFYCWQHKDQADQLLTPARKDAKIVPLRERTSIDTLVDRLGVLALGEDVKNSTPKHHIRRRKDQAPIVKRDTLPGEWQNLQSPLMTVPEELSLLRPSTKRPGPGRSNTKASVFCCIQADDDNLPPPRRTPNRHAVVSNAPQMIQAPAHAPSVIQQTPYASTHPRVLSGSQSFTPERPRLKKTAQTSDSQTQSLLSLIPPTLSPQTTSLLLAELSKPISAADQEGYIYLFWLTPESELSKPDDDAASSLLEPLSAPSPTSRRGSEALQRYASVRQKPTQQRSVLLKIGRAANVHRRLSQWAKQCSHNITLIRYYPYKETQTRTSPGAATPLQKVPHVHRVERLVHLELAEKRVLDRGPCENCGKEHREWFEIEATRNGLKSVDEVIRRWVGWAERQI
jgi:Meiotically up-regulated gene 113